MAAVGEAPFPRHRVGDTSPLLYADFSFFGCYPDATRYSPSSSTHRYSHSRTTHRHSHSRCCCRDRPHGLWELPPVLVGKYREIFDIMDCFSCHFKKTKKISSADGLAPVLPKSSFLGHYALSLRSRFALFAYASSVSALNAATLGATTILPRKARRDPIPAGELDASLFAFAYDTPPFAFAELLPR